jgi:excisionase family DNA binding protein
MSEIKPILMSVSQAAKFLSVSRSSLYGILRENSDIRLVRVRGTKGAIFVEDLERYAKRCAVGNSGGKLRSVTAAARAAHARKAAKAARGAKPPTEQHNATAQSVAAE